MRQLQNKIWVTISRIGGTDTKIIKTETSLHLNLEVFKKFFYFLILFYFILFYLYIYFFFHLLIFKFLFFTLIFILFIFYFQSSLCLANAFSAYSWLVHCLSLLISLKLFLFLSFVFFSAWLFVFPFSFSFFAFHPLSPLHSKYH
jgi:hypothetical protein